MLDETQRRKSNFDEGHSAPVVLADGQRWYLPKPWLEIRPVFRDGKAVSAYNVLTAGPELDELVEAIADADTAKAQVIGVATLAAKLLRHHYALADEDLDQLLRFRIGEEASMAWVEAVIEIATGQSGPKRSRAGGG